MALLYYPLLEGLSGQTFGKLPGALFTSLAAIGLIAAGAQSYRSAEKAAKPVVISCAEFLRAPRRAGWFKLTGCYYNTVEAAYETYQFKSERDESGTPAVA